MSANSVGWYRKLAAVLAKHLQNKGNDIERGQAIVRLVIVPLFGIYMIPAVMLEVESTTVETIFIGYLLLYYMPVACLLLHDVVKRPGDRPARRIFGMAHDYGAILFALSAGGAATLPVYATLLWVSVGYGLRFGRRYLVGATAAALVTLLLATYFNAYWQANPYLVLTLILTTIMVPAYVLVLLSRLQTAYDAAIEANRAKSRFLAQASHDLRQPIHAISLFTACLRDAGLGAEQRQMVDNIDRSLQSVSRLFRSLLDISTLDSGKVVARPEPVSVADLVDDVAQQNSEAAQWAGVTLRVVPSDCHVLTDRTLIATMLQNIVTNALKYAPGEPVLIGCRRRSGELAIVVCDRGPGIAREHLPRIFDEFYQVRERGDKDVEGVGLGLPIVQRLGQLLGLKIGIRSVLGRGTCVVVDGLRIVPAPAVAPRSMPTPLSLMQGMRVMLVEDDQDVLVATATLLKKWGCVVQAETAPPAKVDACDILITDYDLGGGVTGTDCIDQVRRLCGCEVPAIVMTGHDEGRVRSELADLGIPILAKPVRPAELRSILTAQALGQGLRGANRRSGSV